MTLPIPNPTLQAPYPRAPSSTLTLNAPAPHINAPPLFTKDSISQSLTTMGIIRTLLNTAVLGGAGAAGGWAFW